MPEPAKPSCPRCGYDLCGIVESWQDSCPLYDVCSECGLEVRWRDILNPSFSIPLWSFEHVREGKFHALGETRRRARRAQEFWRAMRMEHAVQGRRLVIFALACLVVLTLAAGVVSAIALLTLNIRARTPGSSVVSAVTSAGVRDMLRMLMMPYVPMNSGWFTDLCFTEIVFGFLGLWPMLTAPVFLVLGQTFARCKVRRAHLLRGFAYSLVFLPLPAMVSVAGTAVSIHWWAFGGGRGYFVASTALQCAAITLLGFWLARYWHEFCQTYLKLPHTTAVVAAMMLVGALSSLVVLYAITWGGLAQELGYWIARWSL